MIATKILISFLSIKNSMKIFKIFRQNGDPAKTLSKKLDLASPRLAKIELNEIGEPYERE